VLITDEMDMDRLGSKNLLEIYKGQNTMERNSGFLKDDQIVNALFLKKHHAKRL
jgi:transposase